MKDMFQIDGRFYSQEDENLTYIKEVKRRDFQRKSGLIFLDSRELELDYISAIKKVEDATNQSWGILEKEVMGMIQELKGAIRLFEDFYTKDMIESSNLPSGLTPQQVFFIVNRIMLRIKRMVCVLDPDYSVIKFTDKKSGNNYTMIKGYWINDNGKRDRSLSRNIGNTESSINELTMKLFKANTKAELVMEPAYGMKYKPDIIVVENKIKWMVETKLQNMEDLIKTYVMFESWKMYKEEYDLLT